MNWLRSLFKKRPLEDGDPGVDPKYSNIGDEIQLCKRCPFSGKCEWPDGCSSLQQILKKRADIVTKLRGNACDDDTPRRKQAGRKRLWDIVGIGWRIQLGNNYYKIIRVLKVDDATDTATVMAYNNNHEPNSRQEYSVKIPLLEDNRGNISVDLRKFKVAVKAALNEWKV